VYLSTADSLAAERQKYISTILESLKGRENTACDSVFSNVQTFRDRQRVVVRHFLGIMDYWGRTLNVNCNYCHNTADWASDELRTKGIARQMFNMRVVINNDILAKIADLRSKPARVNCGTCHKGSPFPKE
jgi:photosynthetic reaction center cytochrome c subunit